jgi:predicted site-specific integrase-resolvase
MTKLIKISKLAEDLNVTRQCLYAWVKRGILTFVKSPGGSNYVTEETYNSLLNINKNNSKDDEQGQKL